MGFFEILLIAIVGLVVIGPERLPETVRSIALWVGRIKRGVRETRDQLEQQIGADDIRRQLHNEEVMQRLADAEQRLNDSVSDPLKLESSHLESSGLDTSTKAQLEQDPDLQALNQIEEVPSTADEQPSPKTAEQAAKE